jgi:branched-chain amino acid transport system ATP-binding protein
LLEVRELRGGYGGAGEALAGVSLDLREGEVVALAGRNGMGKTTTVRAITGTLRRRSGSVRLLGRELVGLPPHRIARAGIGLAPEGRQVFPNLTVRENLVAAAVPRPPGGWDLARVHALFPRLRERDGHLGRQLSGGEQQMLAIGRALMTNPRLLVLDEATEGLAPLVRAEIHARLAALKAEGLAVLLVDRHALAVPGLADRVVVVEKGRSVWEGTPAALLAAPDVRERHLGV